MCSVLLPVAPSYNETRTEEKVSFQNVLFEHVAPECFVSVTLSLASYYLVS